MSDTKDTILLAQILQVLQRIEEVLKSAEKQTQEKEGE